MISFHAPFLTEKSSGFRDGRFNHHRLCQPVYRLFLPYLSVKGLWSRRYGDLSAYCPCARTHLCSFCCRDPDRHLQVCGKRNLYQRLSVFFCLFILRSYSFPCALHSVCWLCLLLFRTDRHTLSYGRQDCSSSSHYRSFHSHGCRSFLHQRLFLRD